MNKKKIIIITLATFFLFGCSLAFAKTLPTESERLISFNEGLIEQYQKEWKELDETMQYVIEKKLIIEERAKMARMTIAVLKNEPLGFKQPKN